MSYMPCRHGHDDQAHLYLDSAPDRALCGKSVSEADDNPGSQPVCVECAKHFLIGIFRRPGRISSIDIIVND